ncbi:unnamed protein product [Linum trigynum]|uniref:Uncharacterized protein n=1 Tax=Linum trigynum TaxID=586398 RepID=A0AAV2D083_9ROSI
MEEEASTSATGVRGGGLSPSATYLNFGDWKFVMMELELGNTTIFSGEKLLEDASGSAAVVESPPPANADLDLEFRIATVVGEPGTTHDIRRTYSKIKIVA